MFTDNIIFSYISKQIFKAFLRYIISFGEHTGSKGYRSLIEDTIGTCTIRRKSHKIYSVCQ